MNKIPIGTKVSWVDPKDGKTKQGIILEWTRDLWVNEIAYLIKPEDGGYVKVFENKLSIIDKEDK